MTNSVSRHEIWKMFDALSSSYDKANRWITFGLDRYWRKKVGKFLPKGDSLFLLDCATGTADQAITLLRHYPGISKVIGIDLAEDMLKIGQNKVDKTPFAEKILLQKASASAIPYPENTFDCITLSFGIRNVVDVSLCLQELLRVLKPGGRLLILETSVPENLLVGYLHKLYIRYLLPLIGGVVSGKKEAYRYLNRTAETFPSGKAFLSLLKKAGFYKTCSFPMTAGAVSLYTADKHL